jgi:hypothetical protein
MVSSIYRHLQGNQFLTNGRAVWSTCQKFRRPLNIKSSDSLLFITAEINYIYDVSLSFQQTRCGDLINCLSRNPTLHIRMSCYNSLAFPYCCYICASKSDLENTIPVHNDIQKSAYSECMKATASNIHIQHVLNGKALSLYEWVSADKCSCHVGFDEV